LLDTDTLLELDRRYRVFVKALPPRLAQLASDRGALEGDGPSRPLRTVGQFGVSVTGPWAFRDIFPGLTEEQLLDLGENWIFLMSAILLQDHLADGQLPAGVYAAELQRRFITKVNEGFYSLIGDCPVFWQRFEQYKHQTKSALQLEAYYRTSPQATYDLAVAWHIGAGKSALFKAIPWAMVVLSDEPWYFARLEASINALVAGGQLMDDIVDWREDLARGHYTYPLAQAISRLHSLGLKVSPQAIEALFLESTFIKGLLEQVQAWYRQAVKAVDGVPCQLWIGLLNSNIEECTWYHLWWVICRIVEAAKEKGRMVQQKGEESLR
jgi:hypothetical protein